MMTPKNIGLIAGSGQFPLIFSQKAQKNGYRVFTAALMKEADEALGDYSEDLQWFYVGQLKRLIKFFKKNNVSQAVMMGAVQKLRLVTHIRPDTKTIALLARMRHTHDDGVLRAFAKVMEESGVTILESTFLLPELLAPEGCWTKTKPTKMQRDDLTLGWTLSKKIGSLDIGQSIVVGGGSVLAVEAIDGTDATIQRGGRLGQGEAVLVKTCKPNQDRRFDIPAVGTETIRTMQAAGVKALAVDAGQTVVFDREEMIALANQYKIAIVAWKHGQIESI